MRNHPPWAIHPLLGLLCVVGSMWFGDSIGPSRSAHWLHQSSFAGITALALYVILDVEFPRRGLIRMEGEDAGVGGSAADLGRAAVRPRQLTGLPCTATGRARLDDPCPGHHRSRAARRERQRSQRAMPRGLLFWLGLLSVRLHFLTRLSLRTDKRGIHFLYERFAGPVVGP